MKLDGELDDRAGRLAAHVASNDQQSAGRLGRHESRIRSLVRGGDDRAEATAQTLRRVVRFQRRMASQCIVLHGEDEYT